MVRVTLAGDELVGFPGDGPDRRIRMFFPVDGQDRPAVPRASTAGPVWPAGEARPAIRTYTVRRFDAAAGELDVDFVLHGAARPPSGRATPGRARGWACPSPAGAGSPTRPPRSRW
jgi:NADPH-dependent ferric siderophore reductase